MAGPALNSRPRHLLYISVHYSLYRLTSVWAAYVFGNDDLIDSVKADVRLVLSQTNNLTVA